jgi:hypothetical protein
LALNAVVKRQGKFGPFNLLTPGSPGVLVRSGSEVKLSIENFDFYVIAFEVSRRKPEPTPDCLSDRLS